MNSSMLAGERRWASARRGGMTVLGKVTVPKPINLPSQRLENHGLDPNVEIVPKGTVSWGSRSSSSGSNPWTSSSLSSNADGGNVSPSHLSGRPSSGGSGTRPSTSGSDKTHDPTPNAWASNSRPSSASGTLTSNQTSSSSSSLRARSAENRPNSSQLSRFAEPVSKASAAWGSSVTAERLGVKSLKEDSFSLSSGDFPTLGSEKDNSVKNIESGDCRPSSASASAQAKEDNISHADIKHGTVDTWRADDSPHREDDVSPSMEKWQGDPHQYFNPTAPQHFEGWRGPPMNGPAGGWYGGRPRGPPFGAHAPPGGFPMEPFPYFGPQIPPPALAGSQPVPPPGPRGPLPKNGDLYRPQMHEAYPRPSMPFRPNFYPGPPGPMPFEGYYGPPMGYCNSKCDIPYMGMATGPPVYNAYPAPAPDINNSHVRAAVRGGPSGKTRPEQVETDHSEDTYGPKRVPHNSHNEYEQKEERGHWEQNVPPYISHPGRTRFPVSSRTSEWGAEEDAEEAVIAKRMAPRENPSNSYGNRIHSADGMKLMPFEGTCNAKGVDDNWTEKSEGLPSFPPVVPQLPVSGERDAVLPATGNNSALMHKIDSLNAKFRGADGLSDSSTAYNKGEDRTDSQIVDQKVNSYTREVGNAAGSSQRTHASRHYASAPDEVTVNAGDNPMQPIAVASRRSYHGGHPRVGNRGKGKFNTQDIDGWRKKPLNTDFGTAVTVSNNESTPNIPSHGPNYAGEASENSVTDPAGKTEGDSVEVSDSADIQAQRAKMREIAKQRALQLQREEEERVREQKAKALAKLEELDRRKIAGETANQKSERTPIVSDICIEQQKSHTVIGTVVAELKTNESGFNLVLSPAVSLETDGSTKHVGKSVEVPRILLPVMQQKGISESNVSPLPRNEDPEDGSTKKVVSQSDDGGNSRHKRAGYRQKQNNMSHNNMNEKTVSGTTFEVQKDHTHVAIADKHEPPPTGTILSDSNVLNSSNVVVEPSAQRKRIHRSNKPKPKPDEIPSAPALPPVTSDITHGNESIDNGGSNNSGSNLGASVSTVSELDRSVQTREASSALPSEESQSKVSNQWKPHPSRKILKNQVAHRFTDKHHGSDTVVWAPKAKGADEVSQTCIQESANSVKGSYVAQNSVKGKRAEMERYVPKPQLAQQGVAPSSSSVCSSRSNEGSGGEQSVSANSANLHPVSSATENVRSILEINVGDSSHNKNKRDHGTWRQCGPTDSSIVKGAHPGPSLVSESTKDIQQSKEPVQCIASDINGVNTETKFAGGSHSSIDTTTAAGNKHPSTKDQGATGRGKRHPPRGLRSGGYNPDLQNTSYAEVDGSSIQASALDGNQMDKSTISKETRIFGERTSSHWQRKSSPNSANNQQGTRNAGSESVSLESNKIPRKDNPQHNVQMVLQQDKDSSSSCQPQSQPGQSYNVKSDAADVSVADIDREKKPAVLKGRPYSPNQEPVGSSESPHSNTDDQFEHNATSGPRRTGRQNNRPVGGFDSRRDWFAGHDNRPHAPSFRERQRQNVHLEYQPVGPFKGHKPDKVEELADGGADGIDQRHRERGHSRRGNFYRR